ncbi:MAG: Ferrochelatase, partial [Pseudomonadota bacterium]|nr:Ferrochelatase [Pseudomonadota bacterium]
RYILVHGIIAPFRSTSSSHNYQAIWRREGSPLLTNTNLLAKNLQAALPHYQVTFGMRYGHPSIAQALDTLKNCEKLIILPLYPQYASATTGSSIEKVFEILSTKQVIPSINIIRDFYQHPRFIEALSKSMQALIKPNHHLILSFHGLPERQLESLGCKPLCQGNCDVENIRVQACYRQQCFINSDQLTKALGIAAKDYTVTFQSRLGKTPWIKPYTDETLKQLAQQGIKNIQVACPSFVSDCLETLEEIAISAKEQWMDLGGESFEYIPCLNSQTIWIDTLKEILLENL